MTSQIVRILSFVGLVLAHQHMPPVIDRHNDSSVIPHYSVADLYNMTANFWESFISPNNEVQAKMINSTLFSDDVKGRIDATRTFDGRELNTEYAFGLFANLKDNPGAFTLLGVPTNYTIKEFAGNQNIAASTVVVNFDILPLGVTYPVEINGWFTYNSKRQISQYDATFKWLDWQFASLFNVGMKVLKQNSTIALQNTVSSLLAASVCRTADTFCNGTNVQYDSYQSCFEYLTTEVPFGQSWQMGMDTLLCRMVHQNMVPIRPDVHCPHIGKTGGGYCTNDRQYTSYLDDNYFSNAPFVPYGLGTS